MQNHLHCPHKLEMDSPFSSDNEKEEVLNVSENNLEIMNEINDNDQRKKSPSPEDDDNENLSIQSEPLPYDDDDDDDDESLLSENEDDDDEQEEMPPELLEKMKIFEEDEKQKELEKNHPKENKDQEKINENNNNNKNSNYDTVQSSTNDSNNKVSPKISLQELQKQSKLATQQSLLALGGLRATAEYEKKKMYDRKEELVIQLQNLQEQSIDKLVDDFIKQKKFCQLQTTLDQFFELIQLFQNVSSDQKDMIEKLQKEIKGYHEEKKDDIQEYEKLMKKEEKYWKPNMEVLKKKIELKNKGATYLAGALVLTNINTFIMTYLGFEVYFIQYQRALFFLWDLLKWSGVKLIIFLQYTRQNLFQVIGTLCTLIVIGMLTGQKMKHILMK
jgi:hypothetical protein